MSEPFDMESYILGLTAEADKAVKADPPVDTVSTEDSTSPYPPEEPVAKAKPKASPRKGRKTATEPPLEADGTLTVKADVTPSSVTPPPPAEKPDATAPAAPALPSAEGLEEETVEYQPKSYKEIRDEIGADLVGKDLGKARIVSRAYTVWENQGGSRKPVRQRQHVPLETDAQFVERVARVSETTKQDVQIDHLIVVGYQPNLEPFAFNGQLMVAITPDHLAIPIGSTINLTAVNRGRSVLITVKE